MINEKKMKFKIEDNSYLSIIDDKKETIIHTDRHELKELMNTIKEYLKDTSEQKAYVYRFNPRSRRLEKVEE
jgi:hypothetical protein